MTMPSDKPDASAAAKAETWRDGRVAAASVLALRGDEVLLVKRGSGRNAGLWSAPGGHVIPGETAESAARRELFEETGLTVGPLIPLAVHSVPVATTVGTSARIYEITVFAADAADHTDPQAASDAADARFVPRHRLCELSTTDGLAELVEAAANLLQGRALGPEFPSDPDRV